MSTPGLGMIYSKDMPQVSYVGGFHHNNLKALGTSLIFRTS